MLNPILNSSSSFVYFYVMYANRRCLLFYVIHFNVLNVTADKNSCSACYANLQRHDILNLPILWTFTFVTCSKICNALLFLGHDQLPSSGFYSVMLVQRIAYSLATKTIVSSVDTSHSNDSLKAMPRQILRGKKKLPHNIHRGPNRFSEYNYH